MSSHVVGNRVPPVGQNVLQQSPQSSAFPGYVVTPGRAPITIPSFVDRRQPSVEREPTLLASAPFANPFLLATLFGATPDYREIFKDSLPDAAKAWFTSDWEAHHRYQQADGVPELQAFFKKHLPEHDLHSLDNLVGVPNVVHTEINNIQAQFWEEELERIVKTKDAVVVDDSDGRSKIKAVLRNTNDEKGSKALFKRYQVLVDYIDAEYDAYFAKPEAKLVRLQSISTNLKSFVHPKQVAKRLMSHAKATNPDLYKRLQKRGGINELLNDLIAVEKQGKTSRKFSKLLRYAGIGSFLLMAGSVAQGATSNEADIALGGFIREYEIVSIGQLDRGYAHENELQLVADAFHRYLRALKIPEDTEAKIMTLLRLTIGLNYDAGQ